MLKYSPASWSGWHGSHPGIAILVLLLLPFLDRNQNRHYSKRKIALTVMGVVVTGIVGLTIIASVTNATPGAGRGAGTNSEQITLGQTCIRSTAPNVTARTAKGGVIQGVAGLDGFKMKALHSQDEMYTRTDETPGDIIAFGSPTWACSRSVRPTAVLFPPRDQCDLSPSCATTWD